MALAFTSSGCRSNSAHLQHLRRIAESRRSLLSAIDNSRQIILSRTSLPDDFSSPADDMFIGYKSVILSSDQIAELRKVVNSCGSAPGRDSPTTGMVEPHHAITFKNRDGRSADLVLQISFGNGTIEGGESSGVLDGVCFSIDQVEKFAVFFTELGFRPRADWVKLAAESKGMYVLCGMIWQKPAPGRMAGLAWRGHPARNVHVKRKQPCATLHSFSHHGLVGETPTFLDASRLPAWELAVVPPVLNGSILRFSLVSSILRTQRCPEPPKTDPS